MLTYGVQYTKVVLLAVSLTFFAENLQTENFEISENNSEFGLFWNWGYLKVVKWYQTVFQMTPLGQ